MSDPLAILRATLAERTRRLLHVPEACPAAVLIPLVFRDGVLSVVFTQRSDGLRDHGGQVSFPGGKCDARDADAIATAMREAEEELGIAASDVKILGLLDDFRTITDFRVTPVIALLDPPPAAYRPNAAEVAEVFEVSLARLRDPAVYTELGMVERFGENRMVIAYRPDGRNIWGATARILEQFLSLLGPG